MNLNSLSQSARNTGGILESLAITGVSRLAPWLSPLPTAYLVYDRTIVYLNWPAWVSLVSAITLEFLGLAATITLLDLYNYNRTKRKSDPAAPLLLVTVITAGYFLSAEGLTVILDIATKPQNQWIAADFAPAVFPVLSLAGVVLLAVRSDHNRRLDAITESKRVARVARQKRKEEKRTEAVTLSDNGQQTDIVRQYKTKQEFLAFVLLQPDILKVITPKQIANQSGQSVRNARRWKNEAVEIMKENNS
jgi:hypothetical protein